MKSEEIEGDDILILTMIFIAAVPFLFCTTLFGYKNYPSYAGSFIGAGGGFAFILFLNVTIQLLFKALHGFAKK